VMTGAALLAPVGIFAIVHPALPLLLAIASAVAFAHLVFQINISALIVDLYPARIIATVFGIIGAGSAFGGMLSTQVVGDLVASGRFDRSFVLMATLHPIALMLAWLALRASRRSRLIASASSEHQLTHTA